MPDRGLQVLAPVRPGREEALREVLNAFGHDVRGVRSPPDAPRVEVERMPCLHFFRLALLEDPDGGPGRKRLLLATDFDGTLEAHVASLASLTRGAESIWGACEGYPGPGGLGTFIEAHTLRPDAYYLAYPGVSLGRCRGALSLLDRFEQSLAHARAAEVYREWPDVRDLIEWVSVPGRALSRAGVAGWRAVRGGSEVVSLMRGLGVSTVIEAAKRINATLDRVGWIRASNRLLGNGPSPRRHAYSEVMSGPPPAMDAHGGPPEDVILQNQLTLATEVMPGGLAVLRAVLGLIDIFARRLSPPGSLVGIGTIHSVRWTLLDGGRRLLMVSHYDGTWESYIDEFAEMILSGLDALWSSAPDYPMAGAADVPALKAFLRRHQVPANAFYSAYPEATVTRVGDGLTFERRWGRLILRWARRWERVAPEVWRKEEWP